MQGGNHEAAPNRGNDFRGPDAKRPTTTGEFALARDDEIVKATLVCDNGQVVPRG